MSKVLGIKSDMEKWAKSLPAGNNQIYINFEAAEQMPPQYETFATVVRFDPAMIGKKNNPDFTEISGKYMPTTSMYYKIAEACGISGDTSKVEPLYENVDINALYCKDMLTNPPVYRKIKTGVTVTKQSKILRSDGMYELSSACSNTYNAWDRCTNVWLKEESDTKGYTEKNKWGKEGKYKSPYARKLHFSEELKFADQKSESKSNCKAIRELAGLPTAFEKADLMGGVLLFGKVRKSAKALQLEMIARLSAMEKGNKSLQQGINLFPDEEQEQEQEQEQVNVTPATTVTVLTLEEVLSNYAAILPKDEKFDRMVKWLKTNGEQAKVGENKQYYLKAVKKLADIEASIDDDQKIPHEEF